MKKHDYLVSAAGWMRTAGLALAMLCAVAGLRADTYLFSLLAGSGAALDHVDGSGGNARFFNATSLAVDASGTIYVADGGDHTVRKITAGGVVSTLAGSSGQAGSADGTGGGARFQYPYAIAVDAGGNVFVTDIGDHTVRKITPSGSVSTIAGTAGVAGLADGTGTGAQFNLPQGIAVDATGNVYVSDTNNSTIRKISTTGVVTTLAGAPGQTGTADGTGNGARFNYPFGIAVDTTGNIYVADFGNSSIRKVTAAGNVSTLAGASGQTGSTDGTGGAARFDHPGAVSVDAAGNIYVVDTSNQTIRRVTAGGTVSTLAGSAGLGGKVDGSGAAARFFYPFGIAVNSTGTSIYVADTGNHLIRNVSAAGSVSTLAGATGLVGIADGTGGEALFAYPYGLAVDGGGTVYVADHNNHTIRKVTAGGGVSTFAGGAGLSGSSDGTGVVARFNGPTGVAVDGSGNVYVADADNHTIRKITSAGVVTTFAGAAGQAGSTDGIGGGARFNKPQGVAVDAAGNVYVADTNNHLIRKISTTGTVTTLAGAAGQTGNIDGVGGGARFNSPYGVAVGGFGDVYVADFNNYTIRKVTSTGATSTIAGMIGQSGSVDGFVGTARFNQTYGIAADAAGNVYVADTYNRSIRKITGSGVVTIGGSLSRFYYPQGIAVDASGNLYVADGDNQTITKGTFVASPPSGTPVTSQTVAFGGNTSFTLSSPAAGVTYQWQFSTDNGATWANVGNDATHSGATSATLSLSSVPGTLNGRLYRVQLTNAAGTSSSGTASLTVTGTPPPPTGSARLSNLSVRTQAGSDANAVFVGLAVGGTGSKQMIIRGIGPGLVQFGVTGAMAVPKLTLFNSVSTQLASNVGWSTAANAAAMPNAFAAVGAFSLTAGSTDCAIMQPLTGGVYSAQIASNNGSSGIALAEFYDADSGTPTARLTNASARAMVGTGSAVLTAGFAITGTGTERVLIRGIGPALTQFGVTGALAAPQITVFNSAGTPIANNAGWDGSAALSAAFGKVGAFGLSVGAPDCALILDLTPGTYTVQLSGANSTTGNGLIEVYEVP